MGRQQSTRHAPVPGLSARDVELLRLVAQGMTCPTIADQLGCSLDAARRGIRRIRAELNATTNAQAVVEAMRSGILE